MEKIKPLDFVKPKFQIDKLIQQELIGRLFISNEKVLLYKDLPSQLQDEIRTTIENELKQKSVAIGVITETDGKTASISWIGESYGLHNAWWDINELEVIDNLPRILSNNLAHPFGRNTKQGTLFFPIENNSNQ